MVFSRRILKEIDRITKEMGIPERDISGSFVNISMKPIETSEPTKKDKKE